MYKVRFNLSAGQHFMQWQVKLYDRVRYYDPSSVTLVLHNCKLKNHAKTAQRIHAGENKSVCAWIECDHVEILDPIEQSTFPICYNPKKKPYWTDVSGRLNLDNLEFIKIVSTGRQLFMPA